MKHRGFTLIELLLSIATGSVLIGVTAGLVGSLHSSRVRAETMSSVHREGERVLDIVAQAVRDANDIASPLPGDVAASTLILSEDAAQKNPAVFGINNSHITLSEGGGEAIPVTSLRVVATDLSVSNTGLAGTNGMARVQFTLSSVNPSGRGEYDYAYTFTQTVALRR